MKRLFLILGISLFLLVTPVSAENNNKRENHGRYVSSIAKLKQGGATVSAAAKSDISKLASESLLGKKEDREDNPAGIGTKIEIGALIAVLQNIIESLEKLLAE